MPPTFDDIIDQLNAEQLWDFPGGVHPKQNKTLSNQTAIELIDLPERLYVSVKQHIGVEGHVDVEVGDTVLKGQALSSSMNPFAVPVHAPTSGTITKIGTHVSAHPSGLPELTIEIEPDGKEQWTQLQPLQDYQGLPKVKVLEAICDAGISGMGGAGFPTHIKAAPKKNVEFLVINGVECEPYISSDDRLMREHAWQIRQGIDVLAHLLKPKQVIIAIEDNKSEAIEAMQVACHENSIYMVVSIPTKYPAGGEKQLIQVLTNREVPMQGLPIDVGVIMHNVGTCFAIADAIFAGKPLIQRVVTLSGKALDKPKNVWALIGTPISHLLDIGEYQAHKQRAPQVIMGGPMMGFSVKNADVPVVKITNCILVPTKQEIQSADNEQACIRCGACADACPASLLPQQLFWHSKAKELEKAQEYNLFDCIECGACAYVCPSEIPLVHYYRIAKAEVRVEQEEKQKADKARERFEQREKRLIADQHARDEKHRKAAEARKLAMENSSSDAKDKIAAALARAKAKKQALGSKTTGDESTQAQITEQEPKQASQNSRVADAIARAKAKKLARQAEDEAKDLSSAVDSTASEQSVSNNPKDARVKAALARAKAKREAKKTADISPIEDQQQADSVKNTKDDTVKTAVKPRAKRKIANKDKTTSPSKKETTSGGKTSIATENSENDNSATSTLSAKKAPKSLAKSKAVTKKNKPSAKLQTEPVEQAAEPEPLKPTETPAVPSEADLLDEKKRKIAAAVARAKAKKAAQIKAESEKAKK